MHVEASYKCRSTEQKPEHKIVLQIFKFRLYLKNHDHDREFFKKQAVFN